MKKLVLVLSSVFLLTNVYSQTFKEDLNRAINFIDSLATVCISLADMDLKDIKTKKFKDGRYDCVITNEYATMLLHGNCYIRDNAIRYIEYKDGKAFMTGFDVDNLIIRDFAILLSKKDIVYYMYLY